MSSTLKKEPLAVSLKKLEKANVSLFFEVFETACLEILRKNLSHNRIRRVCSASVDGTHLILGPGESPAVVLSLCERCACQLKSHAPLKNPLHTRTSPAMVGS